MRFEPGINCVVGPNGSGKSNVVDALAWVMGEQGAKNLRGGSMSDVIFAGTSARPALGRAEVSLTIDNTDGALPIDYSEVTISRTLFRSGGSEYAINGTPCRLLDIQELLSDTGMGKEMHVIIGQGRLDEVLTATPEERRGFVEEAAGVLKHRKRKERTLRKIDAMASSFTRIEDLSAELRRQLGPLARQADAARKAQIHQAIVRDAKARLLADDVAQLEAVMEAGSDDERQIAEARAAHALATEHARVRLHELEAKANAAHPTLAHIMEQWERVSALDERFKSLGQIARERTRSLRAGATPPFHGESPEDIRERALLAREEETALRTEVERAGDRLHQAIAHRETCDQRERGLDATFTELSRSVADRREEAARLAGQVTAARQRMESLEAEADRVREAMGAARKRADASAAQCQRIEEAMVASSDANTHASAVEKSAQEVERHRQLLIHAREAEQHAREQLARWTATAEALHQRLEPADATAWAQEHLHRELVRDLLQIEPGWEEAVEAALAGIGQGVATHSLAEAVDTLRAVRENTAGHIDIAIASSADNRAQKMARAALDACSCVEGSAVLATDVTVSLSDGALTGLLGGVVLAHDLVSARALVQHGAPMVATRAGDVLTSSHASGGEVSQNSVLARQSAYRSAQDRAAEAHGTVAVTQEALSAAQLAYEQVKDVYEREAARLSSYDAERAAATAQLGILRQSVTAAQAEVSRGESRLAALEKDRAECELTYGALTQRAAAIGDEPGELAARLAKISDEREAAHQATQAARGAETEARLHLRTREERLRAVVGRSETLFHSAEALAERISREERAAARRSEAARMAGEVADLAERAHAHVQMVREKITVERHTAEVSRSTVDTELREAREHLDKLTIAGRSLDDRGHQRELAAAELRVRHEQLEQSVREQLGMDAATLVVEYGPHIPIPVDGAEATESVASIPYVRAEQEARLAKAERSLARLGTINPLALEEHAALEERHKYLSDQLEDLKKSRADLLRIVNDLDQKLDEVLRTALADVAVAFETVFSRLFPGGEGHLVVTDPASPLTTGIEIEARPPGKRVKRLSLLSGGERSLTAIAFLVAIFMSRPSPFYVMDEVEAALDDVNLGRLLEIFTDLKGDSQLLIVTHQKRTMEIADTIYGVTMREDGVTAVVSQRMADIEPVLAPAAQS